MGDAEAVTTIGPHVVRVEPDGTRIVRYHGSDDSPVAGLWVEVRALRTGRHLQALLSRTYFADLLPHMAPSVVAWDVPGERVVDVTLPADGALPERIVKDVEACDVPPPAETGADAFAATALPDPTALWEWVRGCLVASTYHRDDDGGKDERPSATTPDGTPDASTDPPEATPKKRSRTSRGS
ncbi:hypothetical protein [Nocardioides sp.]|uniref:hypothetical protein n=1 Tax=Nocardioides sp. TaxID=35761 RepID=UPI002C5488C4|nr:hypothetical protein [Nocardioides sp.]HXH79517.1 hypothetical protein [Nocardioides sp.]